MSKKQNSQVIDESLIKLMSMIIEEVEGKIGDNIIESFCDSIQSVISCWNGSGDDDYKVDGTGLERLQKLLEGCILASNAGFTQSEIENNSAEECVKLIIKYLTIYLFNCTNDNIKNKSLLKKINQFKQ